MCARCCCARRTSERANTLCIHTDIRSIKVSELKADPRVAIVAMDAHRGLQIRTRGIAGVTPGDTNAWQSSGDRNLVQYRTVLPPGTPVDTPGDALAGAREKHGPTDGLEHFCVVAVRLTEIDWLDLSVGEKPVRARYIMRDGAWDGTWTVP